MTIDNVCFYLQNRLIQTSQTGGQRFSDTSPFSIPWPNPLVQFVSYKEREVLLIPQQVYDKLVLKGKKPTCKMINNLTSYV